MWDSNAYGFLYSVEREISILCNSGLTNPSVQFRINELVSMRNRLLNSTSKKRKIENNDRIDGKEKRIKCN